MKGCILEDDKRSQVEVCVLKPLVFVGIMLGLIVPRNLNCQDVPSQPERVQENVAKESASTPFPSSNEFRSKIRIQLVRHRCLGTCPIYSVTVFGNGHVVYEGTGFVRVRRRQTAVIAEKAVDDLIRRVNDLQFFSVELPKFKMCVTDGPRASVSASEPGHTREIDDECVESKELQELEQAIDDAVEIQRWVFINHTELQRLISRGWDITVHGREYARKAIEWDDGEVLRVLVKNGLPVDSRDQDGSTLLLQAVLGGRYKSAKALLELGANPKAHSFDGWSPAQNAGNRNVEMCRLFLAHGADINDQDGLGETMLMNAAGSPANLEIVKFLVSSGANLNLRNKNGETAMGIAKRMRQQFQQQIDSTFDPRFATSLADPDTVRASFAATLREYVAVIEFLRQHGGAE